MMIDWAAGLPLKYFPVTMNSFYLDRLHAMHAHSICSLAL
jgi:hypothetical protein